jgi:hypothetical protein
VAGIPCLGVRAVWVLALLGFEILFSGAIVVAAPVDDALLDGFGFEVLGEGFADECGELGVGGEAQGDELFDGELIDVGAIFGGKEGLEAETLFEADDAVLNSESLGSGDTSQHEEDDGHDDPPEEESAVFGPVMDGDVDGEDQVEKEHGQNEEVKRRIETRVVLEVLRSGHGSPLRAGCGDRPQHTIRWGRLERWLRA